MVEGTYRHCFESASRAAGRALSEDELFDLFNSSQRRMDRLVREGLSPQEAAQRAGQELGGEHRLAAIIEERSRKINVIKRAAILDRVIDGDEFRSLEGLLAGAETTNRSAALSVSAQAHGRIAQVMGPLLTDLEKAGLLDALKRRDEKFDADVAREMWRLDEPDRWPSTGNSHAAEAARILHEHQDSVRLMQNKEGAWIGKADHYITRQSHDMWKVRGSGDAAAYEDWKNTILPELDEKTFDNLDEGTSIEAYLRATWQALASGVHESANGTDWLSGFKGPANIAKRVSQNRSLIFKDADGWLRYNAKFGQGHIIDSVMTGMERGARNAAVMSEMGTNPITMFNDIVDRKISAAKERDDFKMVDKLRTLRDGNLLGVVTGQSMQPASKTIAQIGAYMRTWQQVTKLGGVMISSLPDIAVTASVARHNGVPLLEAYWKEIQSLAPNWASHGARNKRQVAQMLGVGIQGHLGAIMNRFAAEDAPLGRMTRMVNGFHKWNGLQYWTDSLSEGLGLMLSHNLGRNAERPFEKLHPKLQESLRRYGMEAPEWDAVRQIAQEAADGAVHILPAETRKLSDAAVAGLMKDGMTADDVRRDLENKLSTYITDQVREGMTEPDPRTQAMVRGSYAAMDRVNPVLGQAMRMFMQFKTFPLTHIRRVWGREVQRSGSDVAGIVHLIAATTVLGYAAMSLKAMLVGKEPRNPADWRTVMAAMQQGGGAGIYGDFLFGEQSRMGNSFLETLAGPTFSDLSKWAKLYNNTRDTALQSGDAPKASAYLAAIVQQASGQIPGGNIFYANAALKYLLFYRLQEMINPGYLHRFEHNVEKNTGQTFFFRPSWSPYKEAGLVE
ncbi:hypothetical protein [Gluconobacter oxydans]|uniref:Uncharacterized protein n=1 Tax=Gluconobacter oxydans TaxID=442 RepID=A0A149RUX4_GLUOY|nr:hypothetical protein [Gluconobacter oxydans]KXV18206.1 hypothetical protein AD934_08960 [Gluconobacter oxydans]